jgi:hypothetical protein
VALMIMSFVNSRLQQLSNHPANNFLLEYFGADVQRFVKTFRSYE